jgi:hypothetical protein
LERDGEAIVAHYLVPFDWTPVEGPDSSPLHYSAMQRLSLLRRLWPELAEWGCQGYGHRILDILHDDTTKRIPARNMPLTWLTSVNGLLHGYEEWHRRPADWREYRDALAEKRQAALTAFGLITSALRKYHRSSADHVIGNSLDADAIEQRRKVVERGLLLPRSAVDEWGFVTESSSTQPDGRQGNEPNTHRGNQAAALRRYRPLVNAQRQWSTSIGNALQQIVFCLAVEPLLARRARSPDERERIKQQAKEMGIGTDLGPLASLNLRDGLWGLPRLQKHGDEIRDDADGVLSRSQQSERTEYLRFASVWEFFIANPGRKILDVVDAATDARQKVLRRLLQQINRLRTDAIMRVHVHVDQERWDDSPSLVLTFESDGDPIAQLGTSETVVEQIRSLAGTLASFPGRITALCYEQFVVILVFRGVLITQEAFVFPVLRLMADRPLSAIDFVPKRIPDDKIQEMRLGLAGEQMVVEASALLTEVAASWALAAHCADLVQIGDADEEAEGFLSDYFQRVADDLSERFAAAHRHTQRILDWANSAGNVGSSALRETVEQLAASFAADLKDGGMRLSELSEARSSLEEARDLAVLVRLQVAELTLPAA